MKDIEITKAEIKPDGSYEVHVKRNVGIDKIVQTFTLTKNEEA